MIKYRFFIGFALLLLHSCITQELDYFEVKPFVQSGVSKLDQPLYVKISKRIENNFSVKSQGYELKIKSFHRSLQYAASQVYMDVFSDVKNYMPGDAGFILEIQQMDAHWESEEVTKADNTHDWYCVMNYTATLYRNELNLSEATGVVRVKLSDEIYNMQALYKEAVKLAFQQVAAKHFQRMKS
jgi:hypothetical protein